MSVFLELVRGTSIMSKYQYRIEMMNHINRNKSIEREFISDFEVGEC